MAPTFTINGYDISNYILWGDRSHDISDGGRISPQFGGNVALADGQPWVRDSANNKTWQLPLWLTSSSTDNLHALVQTINAQLVQGNQVVFKPQGAANSTYFDLERGRLDPHWDLYEDTVTAVRATLTLWTRPYGHTGTTRTFLASVSAATYSPSAGPQVFRVSSVMGDIKALANVAISRTANSDTSGVGRVAAYGFHSSPSYTPIRIPSTHLVTQAGGSIVGASGAIGSQYLGIPTAAGPAVIDYLAPSGAMGGRHRALLAWRHNYSPASGVSIRGRLNTGAGNYAELSMGSVVPTHSAGGGWKLADLGEFTVPAIASGPLPNPATWALELWTSDGGTATRTASFGFELNAVVLIPLEISAGIARETGADGVGGYWTSGDTIEFRSTPAAAVVQRNASVTRSYNVNAVGGVPQLPPGASTLTGIALIGHAGAFVGNAIVGVQVEARERFSYLR